MSLFQIKLAPEGNFNDYSEIKTKQDSNSSQAQRINSSLLFIVYDLLGLKRI